MIVITCPCFLFYLCFPLLHTILHFEEIFLQHISKWDFPGGSLVKNPPANAEDMRSIPGSGRSPGVGHGNPLQYSCLEKPKDRGAWESTFHEVTKSWTRLSDHTHISNTFPFLFLFHAFGPLTFSDTMSFLPEAPPPHPTPHTHHLVTPFFRSCITMLFGGRRTRQRQWNPAQWAHCDPGLGSVVGAGLTTQSLCLYLAQNKGVRVARQWNCHRPWLRSLGEAAWRPNDSTFRVS